MEKTKGGIAWTSSSSRSTFFEVISHVVVRRHTHAVIWGKRNKRKEGVTKTKGEEEEDDQEVEGFFSHAKLYHESDVESQNNQCLKMLLRFGQGKSSRLFFTLLLGTFSTTKQALMKDILVVIFFLNFSSLFYRVVFSILA